jgi:hypothetical protein
MPITYELDRAVGIARLTGTGEVLPAEWVDVMDRILGDPDHEPGMGFLMDRRLVTNTPTTPMIRVATEFFLARAEQLGHCRYASVVSDLAGYGMARMKSLLAENQAVTVQAFMDLAEAEQWLREPTRASGPNISDSQAG